MSKETMKTVIELAGAVSPSLGKSLSAAKKALGGVTLGAAAIGTAVAASALVAVKELRECAEAAKGFEKQLANVGTLLDGDVTKRLNEMNKELLEVSVNTGVVTSDLTDGLYQVVSAFGDSAEATKQLEVAAKAAKAGNATTTDSINLLSAVTKGYGDTSAAAQQKAADLAFQTVKLGQTTFPELAASMGKVIPLANAMSVSQEELFGAMATLTGVTGGTAEVTTQLRGAVQGFLQPTKEMSDTIKEFGYADGKAMLEAQGLQGSLELLKESVHGNDIAFANMFSSIEGKNAVLALTGAQAENFTAKTKAMYEATGAADKAFIAQIDNVEDLEKMVGNCGEVFKIMAGNIMLPYMKDFYSKVLPMVQNAIMKLAPVLEKIGKVTRAVFIKFKPLIEPFVDLVKEVVLPVLGEIWKALMPIFQSLYTHLAPIINKLIPILGVQINVLVNIFRLLYTTIGTALVSAMNIISPMFENFLTIMSNMIQFIMNVFTLQWGDAWQNIVNIFHAMFDQIVQTFKLLPNIIIGIINSLSSGLNALKIDIPKWVPGGMGGKTYSPGIPQIPMLAAGGFTNGVSIAGEEQTEAVISFDPAHRTKNIDIWEKAGEMLGITGGKSVTITLGDVVFSPQFSVTSNSNFDESSLMEQLQTQKSEFADFVLNVIESEKRKAYGTSY